ncbi:MAG: four-carbon acid sugar kinase family protein [Deltaproteobacteria bacterium]|nr:four-carbon acid sugar kinase family protein [Deltaproteobacteria bacterium]
MDRIVILADDFTGAADTGVHFACRGLRTAVVFDRRVIPAAFDSCRVLALSTETRYMTPEDAARTVFDLASHCSQAGGTFFFKKIDSAMRGNPGHETAALLKRLAMRAALVCPALPASGRSVVDGILLVDGRPVHETELGRDIFTPVETSGVADLFASQSGLRAGRLTLADLERGKEYLIRKVRVLLDDGCGAIVPDAVTDRHMETLADLLLYFQEPDDGLPRLLPVGSAGLGKALAAALAEPVIRETIRPHGRLLAVVGSLNASALEQMRYGVESGRFVHLPFSVEAALDDPERECGRLLRALPRGGHVILHGESMEDAAAITTGSGADVAEAYGALVSGVCRHAPFTSVYATGGNIAMSVARHLGLGSLELEEELLPGVALSSCFSRETDVRWFISKAGSFGNKNTLAAIADTLNR